MLLVQYYHFAIVWYFFKFSTLSLNVTCSSPVHGSLNYVILFPVPLRTKSGQCRLFNCSVCLNISFLESVSTYVMK